MIGWHASGKGKDPANAHAGSSPGWDLPLSVKAEVASVPDTWPYALYLRCLRLGQTLVFSKSFLKLSGVFVLF